jgi:hypothetical protein
MCDGLGGIWKKFILAKCKVPSCYSSVRTEHLSTALGEKQAVPFSPSYDDPNVFFFFFFDNEHKSCNM